MANRDMKDVKRFIDGVSKEVAEKAYDPTEYATKEYVDETFEKKADVVEVIANPELSGDEANLTGLQVGETKYKVPQGGGESNSIIDYDIYNLISTESGNGNYYISTTALLQLLTTLGISISDNFETISICKVINLSKFEEQGEQSVDITYSMSFFENVVASVQNISGSTFENVLNELGNVNLPILLDDLIASFDGVFPLSCLVGEQLFRITKEQFEDLIVFVEDNTQE